MRARTGRGRGECASARDRAPRSSGSPLDAVYVDSGSSPSLQVPREPVEQCVQPGGQVLRTALFGERDGGSSQRGQFLG